jgi:hypothetical protein
MDKQTSDALVALAYRLISIASGGVPAPAPTVVASPAVPPPTYPRVEKVNGVNYNLKAPLNPNYTGGLSSVFGQYNKVLSDPSNAPEGFALRSPAGYPLFYPLDGQGKVAGEPRVDFGGSTFESDAAIASYIERTTRTPAQEAQIAADWAEANRRLQQKTETPSDGEIIAL